MANSDKECPDQTAHGKFEQRMPRSDCANAQSDLGNLCPLTNPAMDSVVCIVQSYLSSRPPVLKQSPLLRDHVYFP